MLLNMNLLLKRIVIFKIRCLVLSLITCNSLALDPNQLACSVVSKLDYKNSYRPDSIKIKLIEAKKRTEDFSNRSDLSLIKKKIYKRLVAHSFPLAYVEGKELPADKNLWNGLAELRSNALRDSKQRADVINLTDDNDLYKKVVELSPENNNSGLNEKDSAAVDQVLQSASPLIAWLLQQPKSSVLPTTLVNIALDIYDDDIVLALGIIGTVFDQERMYSHPRNKLAVLGSKMKPLFIGDRNPMGSNYHFWSYLNMALKGDFIQPKAFSYAYEKVYQGDDFEFAADGLGLKTGTALRKILTNKEVKSLTCKGITKKFI